MNTPLFIDTPNPSNPGLIEFNLSEDINIPEDKISWINVSLLVKSDACDELWGINQRNGYTVKDYYRIYGNDDLLWQGDLMSVGVNHVDSTYRYYEISYLPSSDLDWRSKYRILVPPPPYEYTRVHWTADTTKYSIEFKVAITDGKKSIIFPIAGINNRYGKLPTPPSYPPYPPAPPYTNIKLTKNIPDIEAFYHTDFFESYMTKSIIKIDENKFRIFVSGELFTIPSTEEINMDYETIDSEYNSEQYQDITWNGDYWATVSGWRFKEIKNTISSLSKITYSKKPSPVDLKLLITVQNPNIFTNKNG